MPELTIEDRRTALNFASALEFMAAGIPNAFVRKGAHRLVRQIRMRYRFTTAEKKDYIVKVTRDIGGASIADLVEKTGWHRDEILDMAKQLEDEKRIEARKVSPAGRGRGRPAVLFFVVEIPNSAPHPAINPAQLS
jgi:predicted ArsR family transcriptional regulator